MTEVDIGTAHQLRFRFFAEKNGDALAIIDPNGRQWTRRQIHEQVNRLSHALRSSGAGRGSVMALMAPNGADFIIAYLAATQIGMYVVPVNWHLASPEVQYIVENCGATALVVHRQFRTMMESIMPLMPSAPRLRISLHGSIPDFSPLEDFTREADATAVADPIQGRVLNYTSATTGRPKGVSLPLDDAERVLNLSLAQRVALGTKPNEHVQLCASMLYHGAPLEGAIAGLHMGHPVILLDRLEPQSVLDAIDRYRVTMAYIVPSMFARLLMMDEQSKSRYSTASLRKVLHAGAACPVDVKRRMIEWWGPVFWEAYGSTEGAGTVASTADWLRFPGTVGRPMSGTRLRIVGEDGSDLPPGAVGSIYMTRYAGDRFEYLNDPEKTRACHLGEFFTAGDVGYLNTEGYLFLSDRKIDVINLSGAKVYPAELEEVLHRHPCVADCAVLGVPDARLGEAILAVVCPTAAAPEQGEFRRQLIRWLSEHVSIMKIPKYFEFPAELPRDASGKLQKRKLREKHVAAKPIGNS